MHHILNPIHHYYNYSLPRAVVVVAGGSTADSAAPLIIGVVKNKKREQKIKFNCKRG
jgi:hypothetical protein